MERARIFLFVVLAGCWSLDFAENYYVDQSHGSATDNGAGVESTPFKTIRRAADVVMAGDTVFIKQGNYAETWSQTDYYRPALTTTQSGTAAQPIVFIAFQADAVTISTTGGPAIGTYNKDYIIWEGVTTTNTVAVRSTTGSKVLRCDVVGQYVNTTDNHDGIRVENAKDCVIAFCKVHGVKGESDNSAGFKMYDTENCIVEDCYVYDNTVAVYDKDSGIRNTYRRCYFKDSKWYGNNQDQVSTVYIYDCVFETNIELHYLMNGSEIHDNLVLNGRLAGAWAGSVYNTSLWNNIVISRGASITGYSDGRTILENNPPPIAYMDHNLYDAAPSYTFDVYGANQNFSLDDMRGKGFEQHSQIMSSLSNIFADQSTYALLPIWATAGRDGDALGPEDAALVMDTTRYGTTAPPTGIEDRPGYPIVRVGRRIPEGGLFDVFGRRWSRRAVPKFRHLWDYSTGLSNFK